MSPQQIFASPCFFRVNAQYYLCPCVRLTNCCTWDTAIHLQESAISVLVLIGIDVFFLPRLDAYNFMSCQLAMPTLYTKQHSDLPGQVVGMTDDTRIHMTIYKQSSFQEKHIIIFLLNSDSALTNCYPANILLP